MDDKKLNTDIDSIYDSLSGYFPKKYDRSPEELENDIELENKERKLALSMTMSQKARELAKVEEAEEITTDNVAADEPIKTDAATVPTIEAIVPEEAPEVTEMTTPEEIIVPEVEEAVEIPVAESVEDNTLLNKYKSLDELFEDLENEDEEAEGSDMPSKKEDGKLRKTANWFFDFLEVFAVCMTVIILLFSFVGRLAKVEGQSMNNTLDQDDYLIVSNLFYTPKQGDIVVVQNTALSHERLREPLVKRIIATEGQFVSFDENGTVTVRDPDGTVSVLTEPYAKYDPSDFVFRQPIVDHEVPKGCVFVMGDNRDHSTDSRNGVGDVDVSCIFGKAVFRVFPFNSFTAFTNPFED